MLRNHQLSIILGCSSIIRKYKDFIWSIYETYSCSKVFTKVKRNIFNSRAIIEELTEYVETWNTQSIEAY